MTREKLSKGSEGEKEREREVVGCENVRLEKKKLYNRVGNEQGMGGKKEVTASHLRV